MDSLNLNLWRFKSVFKKTMWAITKKARVMFNWTSVDSICKLWRNKAVFHSWFLLFGRKNLQEIFLLWFFFCKWSGIYGSCFRRIFSLKKKFLLLTLLRQIRQLKDRGRTKYFSKGQNRDFLALKIQVSCLFWSSWILIR